MSKSRRRALPLLAVCQPCWRRRFGTLPPAPDDRTLRRCCDCGVHNRHGLQAAIDPRSVAFPPPAVH